MTDAQFTPGPWDWRELGGTVMLVTQRGGSLMVLSPRGYGGVIQTRDRNGTLRAITAEHPNARLIAAAPESHEANKASLTVLCALRNAHPWTPPMLKDIDFAIEANRAALAKVKGAPLESAAEIEARRPTPAPASDNT